MRLAANNVTVSRKALEYLHQQLEKLQEVIHKAAKEGAPLAQRCQAISTERLLDNLIMAFEEGRSDHSTDTKVIHSRLGKVTQNESKNIAKIHSIEQTKSNKRSVGKEQ